MTAECSQVLNSDNAIRPKHRPIISRAICDISRCKVALLLRGSSGGAKHCEEGSRVHVLVWLPTTTEKNASPPTFMPRYLACLAETQNETGFEGGTESFFQLGAL